MKILVTGSSGFVGSAICSELKQRGYDLLELSNQREDKRISLSHNEGKVDISNRKSLKMLSESVNACDTIVHAAATLDKDLYEEAVPLINCLGTQNILWLANQWKCKRFLFISGVSVIGKPIQNPITENHPVESDSAYLASKFFGEQIVRLAGEQGMVSTTFRLSAPVGINMPKNRFLPTIIQRALNDKIIKLSGKGTRLQNYVDVRDVARAVALCIEANVSGLFNIGGSESISNYDLAYRCVARCKSASKIEFSGFSDKEEGWKWAVSNEKARRNFGYKPKYCVDNVIDAVIASYSEKVD